MRARFVVLGTVAALSLAACGSGAGTTAHSGAPRVVVHDPARLIAASADATSQAKTARMSGHMVMHVMGRDVSFTIDGKTALDNSRADVTMDMSSILGMIPGAPAKLVVEARMVGGVMYMDFGDMMRAIAGGRAMPPSVASVKWLKIDVAALSAGGAGSSPSSFTQYLEYLRGVADGGVKTVGADTVRGAATTHYAATIDAAQALQHVNRDSALGRLAAGAAKQMLGTMHVDVWIGDDDHLVHRMQIRFTMTVQRQSVGADMTMDLYDFGVAVNVVPPPAAEVKDFRDLAGLMAGANAPGA